MVHEKLWKIPLSWCNEFPYVELSWGGKPNDLGMK